MKKVFTLLICFLFFFEGSAAAHAAETEATTVDRSTPRLMVTEYSLDTGVLTPGETGKLTVTLKNTNNRRAIFNLRAMESDRLL